MPKTAVHWPLSHKVRMNHYRVLSDSIYADFAAVHNALKMEWSAGQTEGQINRLKFIKRQGYGRASFELLRKRVLYQTHAA